MSGQWRTVICRAGTLAAAVLALGIGSGVLWAEGAAAQHKANPNDMEVPTHDMKVVEMGRAKYAQRCSFCHGGDGHGGKGPCLSCGTFKFTGNTNAEIYATIAAGVPRNLGGTMGAFGTTMTPEEIISVIAFLRWEEKRRIEKGEIPDPYKMKSDELPVFPVTN